MKQFVTSGQKDPDLLLSSNEDQDESLHHVTAAQVHRQGYGMAGIPMVPEGIAAS